jgi:hypothetical protein
MQNFADFIRNLFRSDTLHADHRRFGSLAGNLTKNGTWTAFNLTRVGIKGIPIRLI